MSKPGLTTCTNGPKTRYRSRKDAIRNLSRVRQYGARFGFPSSVCRVYKCPFCQGFHLTSQYK